MATTENLEKYKHFKKEVKYSSFQLPEMPPHDILVYFVLSFFYACIYTFPWSIYSSAFYVFMFCFFTYIIKHFKNHDFFIFVQDSIVSLHQSLFIQSNVISNALIIINNTVMLSLHLSSNFSLFGPRRLFFGGGYGCFPGFR